MPNFKSLPPHLPFADTLARLLMDAHGSEPLALARVLVLLPSRRACLGLQEAFLRITDGAPHLLPRLVPLGELDAETDLTALLPQADVKRILGVHERTALMARLVLARGDTTPARAHELALKLAALIDDATRYNLSFDQLETLAPAELAAHWQQTLEFLKIVTRHSPAMLEQLGATDHVSAQQTQLLALAQHWQESPPPFAIIAAGMNAALPATAQLLAVISRMEKGRVILPGLDKKMPAEMWDALPPTHPQYGMKQLLNTAECPREAVEEIESGNENISLRELFAPAEFTAHWRDAELPLAADLSHIRFAEATTQQDEARMIAYCLREALEIPEKTAALITPDRTLARMVAAECARYNIIIDDSAGTPLSATPPAMFMQLILEAAQGGFAPVPLMALLSHPLTRARLAPGECRKKARALERKLLRGPRLAGGMDALLEQAPPELRPFVESLRACLRPLEMAFIRSEALPLADWLQLHIEAAESLATSDNEAGAAQLWAKEAGRALSALLANWREAANHLPPISARDYPSLFAALLSNEAVRLVGRAHPRLQILSPLEARLSHVDFVILGELNEGVWPASPSPDPWMSVPMRAAFGLPPADIRTGQSAHDLWMLAHAPRVLITRARKIGGKPADASRWWVRLSTLVRGKDEALFLRMDASAELEDVIKRQDDPPAIFALSQPRPKPPNGALPARISVSLADLWQQDAYAFYARAILKLNKLPELDEEPDASDFGQDLHKILEEFLTEFPGALPPHALQRLLLLGERHFLRYAHQPAIRNLWWPRFAGIAAQFLAREEQLRQGAQYRAECELSAEWDFSAAGRNITLTARADRVDTMKEGFRLIDYKTGTPPTKSAVESGEALQLPLTALALIRSGRLPAAATSFAYWALKARAESKHFVSVENTQALMHQAEERLVALISNAARGEPYEAPAKAASAARDYEHLTRREEWLA